MSELARVKIERASGNANGNVVKMEMNLDSTKFIGVGPSERNGEVDQLTIPISHHPGSLEVKPFCEMIYPPSPLLSALVNMPISLCSVEKSELVGADILDALPVSREVVHIEMNLETKNIGASPSESSGEIDHVTIPTWHHPGDDLQIEVGENSDHTITIPEPPICRICADDEDENDDVLVELGCRCKGQMSRMHRKCILEWYGLRMLLDNNYNCELCNTILQVEAQLVVTGGVADHQNGGRAILINALKLALAPYAAHIDVDSAPTYPDLVYLLLNENENLLRQRVNERNANIVDDDQLPEAHAPECSLPVVLMFSMVAIAVGAYFYLLNHYYGDTIFH